MKRLALAALLAAIPLSLFAQAQQAPERRALQQLGLSDAQVSQVLDLQARTRDTLRQGAAQLRVLRAQIDKAMLASPVDMTAVNALVDQVSQARAGLQKTLLSARAQMQQVMGVDNFQKYMRGMRRALAHRFPQGYPMRRLPPGAGGYGLWM
jgi:septal ring factor EnvC (AmiA/AmiB activator)